MRNTVSRFELNGIENSVVALQSAFVVQSDEVPDRADVVRLALRERQRLADQSAAALAEGTPESLDVVGETVTLAARCVLTPGHDRPVRREEVGRHGRPVAVLVRQSQPQAFGGKVGAVADDEGHDLAGVRIEGRPDPPSVGLRPHKAL